MYLMDTHTLLWYLRNSQEISKKSLEIINSETTIFVSIASLWEIAIKNSILWSKYNLVKKSFFLFFFKVQNIFKLIKF